MDVAKAAVTVVRQLKLNTGAFIPTLSIGLHNSIKRPKEKQNEDFEKAVKLGYRHFETALYTKDQETDMSITGCLEKGLCKREDLFICTRVGPREMFPGKIQAPLVKALAELNTDYLDLYVVQWPHRITRNPKNFNDFSHIQTYHKDWMTELWSQLESIVDNGTVKAIGVSNFTIRQIDDLLANCKIPPAVNQVENNLYFQYPLMKQYLDSKNIIMQSYCHLGDATRYSRVVENPVKNETVKRIAQKHDASPRQVCLAFLMAEDRVVITTARDNEAKEENFNSVKIQLTEEDIQDLRREDKNIRSFTPRFFIPHSLHVNFWDKTYEKDYEQKFKVGLSNN